MPWWMLCGVVKRSCHTLVFIHTRFHCTTSMRLCATRRQRVDTHNINMKSYRLTYTIGRASISIAAVLARVRCGV